MSWFRTKNKPKLPFPSPDYETTNAVSPPDWKGFSLPLTGEASSAAVRHMCFFKKEIAAAVEQEVGISIHYSLRDEESKNLLYFLCPPDREERARDTFAALIGEYRNDRTMDLPRAQEIIKACTPHIIVLDATEPAPKRPTLSLKKK